MIKHITQLSLFMSFKLADLVNIALEEGTYFKSDKWCQDHKDDMFVEHSQQDWSIKFFKAYTELVELESSNVSNDVTEQHCSTNFQPIVDFFKKLD